ncbi:MAG: tetratricopeptide repeat protein [Novosphingobium sp.]|nr:tetratricopeptide repeat protein [Novosphingobium sp.]
MSIALLLAGALAVQSADQLTVNAAVIEEVDVAYQALAEGRNRDAVAALEDSDLVRKGDPAALINLGTAHARLGRIDRARQYYKAAIASEERYVLELQDGSWVDSRRAAMMASQALARGGNLALR